VRIPAKGSRVSRPEYGPGTITSADERYTVIEFDNHGRRVFITDMVTLESTNEPAPVRAKAKRRKPAAAAAAAPDAAAKPSSAR
jgi:hypothetical protein